MLFLLGRQHPSDKALSHCYQPHTGFLWLIPVYIFGDRKDLVQSCLLLSIRNTRKHFLILYVLRSRKVSFPACPEKWNGVQEIYSDRTGKRSGTWEIHTTSVSGHLERFWIIRADGRQMCLYISELLKEPWNVWREFRKSTSIIIQTGYRENVFSFSQRQGNGWMGKHLLSALD